MKSSIEFQHPRAARRLDDAVWRALATKGLRGSGIRLCDESLPCSAADNASTHTVVRVREPAAFREVVKRGSVGLGRTYAAGWWEADDLVSVLRLLTRRVAPGSRTRQRLLAVPGLLRAMRPRLPRDKVRDRQDVQAHYDLGDDFFALFLDPTLTYSCAYFERSGMTLAEASIAKLERICELAALKRSDAVLEIGTGWGSFALHAAKHYGCSVTTTTVSARQHAYARRRVREEGLDSQVSVLDLDYRDLEGKFDKVVSIEMIEAVGWRQLDTFLGVCARLLRPSGTLVLQAIVIDDELYENSKRRADFIKTDVFPGSTIPSIGSILRSARRTGGLRLVECHDIGLHYVETLARWRCELHRQRAAVHALGLEKSFYRLWDFYLAYCQAGFAERRISDVQLVFEAPDARRSRGTPAR